MFDDKTKFNPEESWSETDNDKNPEEGSMSGEKGGETTRVERDMDEQLGGTETDQPSGPNVGTYEDLDEDQL